MSEPREVFVYVLQRRRETFPDDATDAEQAVMREHLAGLRAKLDDGTLLLAGPARDAAFGLVVFLARDEREAAGAMRADPAVRAAIMTAHLHPYKVTLANGALLDAAATWTRG